MLRTNGDRLPSSRPGEVAGRLDGRRVPHQRSDRSQGLSLPPRPTSTATGRHRLPEGGGARRTRRPSTSAAAAILFGSSNDPRDQLGAILIESGKITPEQLEDVNAQGRARATRWPRCWPTRGFVSQRELSEAARAKVERILSDVLAYTTGSFEFEDGVLPKGAVDLKLATERLVWRPCAASPIATSCCATSTAWTWSSAPPRRWLPRLREIEADAGRPAAAPRRTAQR